MAIGEHAIRASTYDSISDITASTDKRDVSELLDLWAHKWTPVLNKVSWGEQSGALSIEWISEHLGYGYVETSTTIASNGTAMVIATCALSGLSAAERAKEIQAGTVMFAKGSTTTSSPAIFAVTTIDTAGTITLSWILVPGEPIPASAKIYIVGHFANEGSEPYPDSARARVILSNAFTILRKDIAITGTMMNTDMHAVSSEPNHQMAMRLLEMQLERERTMILSYAQTRSATVAGLMNGMFGFLFSRATEAYVDQTTTTLTEDKVNDMVAEIYSNGGTPDILFGDVTQTRKFTAWDQARVRTTPDSKMGGHFVTKYLTDVGMEIELVPMRKFPVNICMLVDTSQCKLRAKKNRKLIYEKLAKTGDYERWQLLSEFTFEMRGYDKGYHAMWTGLAA